MTDNDGWHCRLIGGHGNDRIDGGEGNDAIVVDESPMQSCSSRG
ncbi:hypothetical protein ACFCYF_03110 [Streptomyces chartreusis]